MQLVPLQRVQVVPSEQMPVPVPVLVAVLVVVQPAHRENSVPNRPRIVAVPHTVDIVVESIARSAVAVGRPMPLLVGRIPLVVVVLVFHCVLSCLSAAVLPHCAFFSFSCGAAVSVYPKGPF